MAADTQTPNARRSLFIGDVQGCGDELDLILDRATARFGEECVFHFVGDLVNRGPYSMRVLERVRKLADAGRAHCVLGNHEINLITQAFGLREAGERDTIHEILGSQEADDWLDWLRALPLVESAELSGCPFAMVHAAVHPDWDLETLAREARRVEARLGSEERDDAYALLATPSDRAPAGSERDVLGRITTCRSVLGDEWSSALPEGDWVPWHTQWSKRHYPYGIVYGHWSLQGLHVAEGLRGLDTGCVHHGRNRDGYLTAWVPELATTSWPFDTPDTAFWRVRGYRRYYPL
ncbi:MAG: metallophosphoesterase [Deltaproteobacteria bacterium]|jgi:bis(5'-nucleosyl)-tetraphosphatase (symmetrical)|nr:metallophosphoesterase [Deltaproteobacteria bacterium]MBW2383343.1 metallophosphoesterase [Deltaproteobacteria bacterium]MBW2694827.1 metallophosphoesterase [Deltaproteobacteria bacterium]